MPSQRGTYLLGSCRHKLEFIRYGIGLLRGNSAQQYSIHTGMGPKPLAPYNLHHGQRCRNHVLVGISRPVTLVALHRLMSSIQVIQAQPLRSTTALHGVRIDVTEYHVRGRDS